MKNTAIETVVIDYARDVEPVIKKFEYELASRSEFLLEVFDTLSVAHLYYEDGGWEKAFNNRSINRESYKLLCNEKRRLERAMRLMGGGMRKPKIKHRTVIRLSSLLDMEYTPAELAKEISVSLSTIYKSYLPSGVPCRRDTSGRIWIHGKSFSGWAREFLKAEAEGKVKYELPNGWGWCMKCNKPVEITSPRTKRINRHTLMMVGTCAVCSRKVNRFTRDHD